MYIMHYNALYIKALSKVFEKQHHKIAKHLYPIILSQTNVIIRAFHT